MTAQDDLLDIRQAAALLNVTETSLRRWTDAGRLACLRVGARRERRFRRSDLLAFLEHQPAINLASAASAPRTLIAGLPVEYGTHLCSFYSSDAARTTLAASFLADGLTDKSAAFLFAAEASAKPVVQQLGDASQLTVLSYRSTRAAQLEMLENLFVSALAHGCQSMRLVGNVSESKLAQRKSFAEVMEYELGYARISRRFPIVTLCQYDARRHTGKEVCSVLKCHPDLFRYPAERLAL
jgi:excisionase family DNA binding protein